MQINSSTLSRSWEKTDLDEVAWSSHLKLKDMFSYYNNTTNIHSNILALEITAFQIKGLMMNVYLQEKNITAS